MKSKFSGLPMKVIVSASVVGMLFSNVLPLVADATGTNNDSTDTTTNTGSDQKGIKVTVPSPNLDKAIANAKKAGEEVTQNATKTKVVTASELAKEQAAIKADEDKQATNMEETTNAFNKALADWEAYMKNPDFVNNTDWPEEKIREIFGSDLTNLSYVTAHKGMTFNKGNLQKVNSTQIKDIKDHDGNISQDTPDVFKGETSTLFTAPIKVGSWYRQNKAFVDSKTGKNVDVKTTITGVHMLPGTATITGAYATFTKNKLNGINSFTPIQSLDYKNQFYENGTNTPIKVDALEGVGDIDAKQQLKWARNSDGELVGSLVVKSGNTYTAKDNTAYDNDNKGTQVWSLFKNVSEINYSYGVADDSPLNSGDPRNYYNDYHVLGNIDFALKIKPRPATPEVSYTKTDLIVVPDAKKDVDKDVAKGNPDGSIDNKDVKVGDNLNYSLTNSDLPANRVDDIKTYTMTDTLPDGVKYNATETEKLVDSKLWKITVDGQKITFAATADLLKSMNADKTKAYKVPITNVVATVVDGSKDLKNTFTTTINDEDVKSNEVDNKSDKVDGLIQKRIETKDGLKTDATIDDFLNHTGSVTFDLFNRESTDTKQTHFIKDNNSFLALVDYKLSDVRILGEDQKTDQTDTDLTDNKYTKDITKDFTLTKNKDGLSATDKDGKYAGQAMKLQIKDVKLKASVDAKDIPSAYLTKGSDGSLTFKGVNVASNEDGKSNEVTVDDKQVAKVTKTATATMAQTGGSHFSLMQFIKDLF